MSPQLSNYAIKPKSGTMSWKEAIVRSPPCIEFAYGDIYSRPGLDLKQRQLLTIACLTTQGDCEPELSVHINTSLNVGLSQTEVVEAILHCVPYVGFPRVMNAMTIAKKVFESRG